MKSEIESKLILKWAQMKLMMEMADRSDSLAVVV